nr:13s globulin basic chain [Quercus suber]
MPQGDYIVLHRKRYGYCLDHFKCRRKKEAREVHKRSQIAQKALDIKGKMFAKKCYVGKAQMKKTENIHDPSHADIYNPEAGQISTLNSHNLVVLRWLQLSAEFGRLQRGAIYVPHWNRNAHSIIYVVRGRAQLQVVDNFGRTVFDDELQQDQILTVPQNFVVVKWASSDGFEWVAFKTNDTAQISPLAGQTSVLRAIPADGAIYVPHWNRNAHSIIYVVRGRAQLQVVDNFGRTVFDDELQQDQILTVPQNFVVVKWASSDGFEWVAFKTNDTAQISPLAGQTSVLRAIPADVLANTFQLRQEDISKLKLNLLQQENT